MDDSVLRRLQVDEDVVLYRENTYRPADKSEYLSLHEKMRSEGKIRNRYEDAVWVCSSDIRSFELNFEFSHTDYKRHFGKESGLSVSDVTDMLKCYALHICGEFIFRTIAMRVSAIKEFLTKFGDAGFRMEMNVRMVVADFLSFSGAQEHEITSVMSRIGTLKTPKAGKRELADLINYLAIDSELTDMYSSCTQTDEEFIQWFPLYFWTKVTFILPLRATEMLVTPFDCVSMRDGETFLTVRRTVLKGRRKTVFYDVDRDYRLFEYRIPENETVRTIEKYRNLTACHERRFLFEYGEKSVNGIMSLATFNFLLSDFVNERLIGNRKYDYSRFACGIREFETVTAGDSRPIAMANLYYQDAGADICRQLANHVHINTSAGYYTNVSNTVLASSVMHLQRKLNYERRMTDRYSEVYGDAERLPVAGRSCSSPHRPDETGDITDCIAEDHLYECFGCRYYTPGGKELEQALSERKKALDEASMEVLKCMAAGTDAKDADFDKAFLDAHTGITRYKTACDENAKERLVKWQRRRSTATNCS